MKQRCPWVEGAKENMIEYHDKEWGRPSRDDKHQFEMLTLEAAQAGLSWSTVLNKRENYRKHFANFDPKKVAKFDKKKIENMLKDPGIIRNRQKVEAAVNNAKRFLEVQKEFGSFSKYIWKFVGNKPIKNTIRSRKDYQATCPESDALSKDLKARGFKFVGSTIMYAHMQATGLVNDHSVNCFCRK